MSSDPTPTPSAWSSWYWLLVLPFLGLLIPVYLKDEPSIGGFPFFYWYQLAWVPVSALLTWTVYVKTRREAS